MICGIPETQEMLDFCAEHGIVADIEMIRADQVNEAYERLPASNVKYRFVMENGTLGDVAYAGPVVAAARCRRKSTRATPTAGAASMFTSGRLGRATANGSATG